MLTFYCFLFLFIFLTDEWLQHLQSGYFQDNMENDAMNEMNEDNGAMPSLANNSIKLEFKLEQTEWTTKNKRSLAKIDLTKIFECVCGRTYSKLRTLRYHKNVECGKEPRHCCSKCTYRTYRTSNLASHIRVHHNN